MKKVKFSNDIIKGRFIILLVFLGISFSVIIYRLIDLIIFEREFYTTELEMKSNKEYISKYAPRGRILDRNGNVIVDNKEIYTLTYEKSSNVTSDKELVIVGNLINVLDLNYEKLTEADKINYILVKYKDKIESRINENVENKYNNRELSKSEYENYLYKLVTKDDTNSLTEIEIKEAYLYSLMNEGYRNSIKTIKEGITLLELENIKEYEKYGFSIGVIYERTYPYGDTFREYLGNIGSIPKEEINEYIKKGYSRTDTVGVSFLEREYEHYLKGQDEKYILTASGDKIIVDKLKNGTDITLSIDINLQKDIEDIIYRQVVNAKKEANTAYFNRSFVIMSNPMTGEILASAGTGVLNDKDYTRVNYLSDLTNYAVTPGSIVKGASHLVGYKYGAIDIGYTVTDGCIKVKNSKEKCSWKSLGRINDLTALKYSSNYYQFLIAIKIGNGNYGYNKGLSLDTSGFIKYRSMYNSFGLGVKTGIDVPNETIGVVGSDTQGGALLDYPIGQYETYTPMQLMQYINTLASSGKRYSLHYLKSAGSHEYENKILNEVDIESIYMERVREGLKMVMEAGGTGRSHINPKYNVAGKTGTAQSFIDTNHDGKIDTETISSAFGGYMPYDSPTVSIVVLSPNVSNRHTSFTSKVNRKIAKEVTDLYFEKYNK